MRMTPGDADRLVTTEVEAWVGWLVLDRPEKLNAMSAPMLEQFSEALTALVDDDAVRVIVIRGAGRAFSSGYDMERDSDEVQGHPEAVEEFARLRSNIERFRAIWECPKPVIAAIHGYCLAGATQLAAFCDITVVAEDAVIGLPKIPAGGGYITPIWTWLIGPKRAKQMAFSAGSSITGARAVEWGWANYCVPELDLWTSVTDLAVDIARTSAPILRMKKHAINRIADIQGFSASVFYGAETDALLHLDPAVGELSALIREKGLKNAIAEFGPGRLAP